MVQHEIFNSKATAFEQKVDAYHLQKGVILDKKADYRRDTPTIILTTSAGLKEADKVNLKHELEEVGLEYAKLEFREGDLDVEVLLAKINSLQEKFTDIDKKYSGVVDDLFAKSKETIKEKDDKIEQLQKELAKYKIHDKRIHKPVNDIAMEFGALYPEAREISYSELVKMNTETSQLDTLPTVVINWKGRNIRAAQKERISKFFQTRMKLDTIEIVFH